MACVVHLEPIRDGANFFPVSPAMGLGVSTLSIASMDTCVSLAIRPPRPAIALIQIVGDDSVVDQFLGNAPAPGETGPGVGVTEGPSSVIVNLAQHKGLVDSWSDTFVSTTVHPLMLCGCSGIS